MIFDLTQFLGLCCQQGSGPELLIRAVLQAMSMCCRRVWFQDSKTLNRLGQQNMFYMIECNCMILSFGFPKLVKTFHSQHSKRGSTIFASHWVHTIRQCDINLQTSTAERGQCVRRVGTRKARAHGLWSFRGGGGWCQPLGQGAALGWKACWNIVWSY